MKAILNLCVLCLVVALVGCDSTDEASSSPAVSPGAISECGVNCECCESSPNYKSDASLGAVGEGECSGAASSCDSEASTCDKSDASLGAVSEGTCPSSASTCSKSDG